MMTVSPNIQRLACYVLGTALVAAGGANEVLGADVVPHLLAQLVAAVGTYVLGYATTAKQLGDLNTHKLDPSAKMDATGEGDTPQQN